MSKPKYIISTKNQKMRLPVISFVALWLLMDRLKSPDWLWGIYWFVAGLVFIIVLIDTTKHDHVNVDVSDLLKKEYDKNPKNKEDEQIL